MTTNKDLLRRETDKLGEWIQQAALDDANKRIAELEREINSLMDCCYFIRRELHESQDIIYFSVLRINEAIDKVIPTTCAYSPPAAAKEGE